ncbi:hypothetical protein DF186_17270, partial [Enterococcus hirae]
WTANSPTISHSDQCTRSGMPSTRTPPDQLGDGSGVGADGPAAGRAGDGDRMGGPRVAGLRAARVAGPADQPQAHREGRRDDDDDHGAL